MQTESAASAATGATRTLTNIVPRLLQLPDMQWGFYTLYRSGPTGRRVSNPEEFIANAWSDAHRIYAAVQCKYGDNPPRYCLQDMGVQVVDAAEGEVDMHFIRLASYDPIHRRIELSQRSLRKVEESVQTHRLGERLGDLDIEQTVLWHELFHVLQNSSPQLGMHGTEMSLPRKINSVSRNVARRIHEEIAAVQFSKLASGISFCPEILQVVLVHALDAARANKMIEDILGGEGLT